MKKITPVLLLPLLALISCSKNATTYSSFDNYPVYKEADLWLKYTKDHTVFSLWSPTADMVKVNLYHAGHGGECYESISLSNKKPGLWSVRIDKDLAGVYYTYQVKINDHWLAETPGIYATAVGVSGHRAMVIDMGKANPEGWEADKGPIFKHPNEAIIYELHIRDITSHPNAGSAFPGKYNGLVEEGTTGPHGVSTAIDHMVELGITHVQLLPSYDHYSIDESRLDSAQFNWGYDPQNYNVPEGSFSQDPFHAEVRIKEFKKMVKAFHDQGIGVILDVVYNHTGRTEGSNFNLEVPGYYYRQNTDGTLSDASACGNETASERAMVRKFIIESVLFWAREYHLDGFRFDLMGIHDIETMNQVALALKQFNPGILIYGEGWTAADSPLPEEKRALKKYTYTMPNIGAFSDDIRDGLKGSVFEELNTGFVNGAENMDESVKFGVVGSIFHEQVDYSMVIYSDTAWTNEPWQAISYVSCHDNQTLFDKLTLSAEGATAEQITAMHKLANAVVLTSQGTPFLHAGVEMKRTKGGDHNSYNKPDRVNQINWQWKVDNKEVFNYYRKLIALRKAHPAFFMPSADLVRENLNFLSGKPGQIGYHITGNANGDPWKEIAVYYNANPSPKKIILEGEWRIAVLGDEFDEQGRQGSSGSITIPSISMLIAFRR